jgi:hypothetical protein
MTQKIVFLLAIVAVFFFSSACGSTRSDADPVQPDFYQVDPIFREFYDLIGGKETLGPAISPVFDDQNANYQYTEAALMVHEPRSSGQPALRLAPLGLEMGIAEPPVPDPEQPGMRYINGHIIYEAFLPMYEKLGGARYVGKPITEVHFNPNKGRYEQYFENLGFYQLEQDPPGDVHMLAYGVWKCDSRCRQRDLGAGTLELPFSVGKPFRDAAARLGPDFTGFAISEVYQTPDNYSEQIFENLVLVMAPDRTGRVYLRPITASLGIRPDKPIDRNADREGFYFVPVQGDKGYFVYQKFMDYIAQHGGLDASGEPINEFAQVDDRKSRQCFTNLCLEEYRSPSGSFTIRPVPNGYIYKDLPLQPVGPMGESAGSDAEVSTTPASQQNIPSLPASSPTEVAFSASEAQEVVMRVWETYPLLAPDQNQEIGVSISENNVPLSNLEPYLAITLPTDETKTYYMDLTGEDGVSRYMLDPINAPNGTLIPYQVCVLDLNNEKYCVRDSFMIWQNQ